MRVDIRLEPQSAQDTKTHRSGQRLIENVGQGLHTTVVVVVVVVVEEEEGGCQQIETVVKQKLSSSSLDYLSLSPHL